MSLPPQTIYSTHHCVQPQKHEHKEEAHSPELREGHHGDCLRKSNECQSWTWEINQEHLTMHENLAPNKHKTELSYTNLSQPPC